MGVQICLHNVGPIRDADITFRGLSVLVGPNGTGKTTVSAVAYAAITASERAYLSVRRQMLGMSLEAIGDDSSRLIDRWEDSFRRSFEEELRRCVTRDLAKLGREGRVGKGAAPRVYLRGEPRHAEPWCIVFRLDSDGLVVERSNKKYRRPALSAQIDTPDDYRQLDTALSRVLRLPLPIRSYYFPAARSGFMQTFSALTALVFGALGSGYFEDATVGTIPGTTADFLRFLAQTRPDAASRIDQDATEIFEADVLKGDIRLTTDETARGVTFQPQGLTQSWPLESAATSAAELAPLVLYLRHVARRGDAIFIDEPEAHFHPASQVALARGLMRMAGLLRHVVIATHSEFLVSGLSNLLLEQSVPRVEGRGHADVPVDVFEFQPGKSSKDGVMVVRLDFDPREGLDVRQFSAVADDAFAQAVELHRAVHGDGGVT